MDGENRREGAPPQSEGQSLEDPVRRQLVVGAARKIAALILFGPFAVGAGSDSSGSASSSATGASSGSGPGRANPSQPCALYPEQTEGPYYRNVDLVRRDVTEGKPGTPLTIALQVLRKNGCEPIPGADVEIWHADARGAYSDDETFLRGTQTTDCSGSVKFETIYPGWYPGRTTHIHFKVHLPDRSVVTSQVYFPEEVTAAVYATAPYSTRGPKDTSNVADSVYAATTPPLVKVSGNASGYLATVAIAVAA